MIIQNIVIPDEQCIEPSLYVRNGGDFSTYFNMLSLTKWRKYTDVGEIRFEGTLKGRSRITLELLSNDGGVARSVISSGDYEGSFSIPIPSEMDKGMVAVTFGEPSSIDRACFSTETPLEPVCLALAVCTFKREKFLLKKVEDFNASLNRFDSRYGENVELFVSDNAGTIPEDICTDKVHLFVNRNVGGSGGFARSVLEANRSGRKFDRVVFMDDDTVLDYETIYRMWTFASYLKEDQRNLVLGGSMLRLDKPTIFHETNAVIEYGRVTPHYQGLNASTLENCLLCDTEQESNYNAWWLCCTPNTGLLPAPMFISWDDGDYGLQLKQRVVNLNGVAVWHESFQDKYRAWRHYFDARNIMIMHAFNGMMNTASLAWMCAMTMSEVLSHRFKNAELRLKALDDFLKGPEYYMQIEPENFLQSINKEGDVAVPLTEEQKKLISKTGVAKKTTKAKEMLSIATMSGFFLPASKKTAVVPLAGDHGAWMFFRKGKVLHCCPEGIGFETERDPIGMLRMCLKVFAAYVFRMRKIFKVSKEFQEKSDYIHSTEFWMKYLNLEESKQEE